MYADIPDFPVSQINQIRCRQHSDIFMIGADAGKFAVLMSSNKENRHRKFLQLQNCFHRKLIRKDKKSIYPAFRKLRNMKFLLINMND